MNDCTMNQVIYDYVANQQRPSVIKLAGKDGSLVRHCNNFAIVADHSSAQQTQDKYQPLSGYQEGNRRKQAASSGESNAGKESPADSISNTTSSSQSRLKRHRDEKYNCRFCGKSFQWYSHWQAHERTHTGQKPFKCDECDKAFARSDGLQCHKGTHIDKTMPSYHSPENTKVVGNDSILYPYREKAIKDGDISENTYEQIVTRPPKRNLFKCHICNRTLFSSAGLVKHVKRHKGKKEFICDPCGKVFTKQSSLEIHNRIHTGVRPYQCNTCYKAFSIYGNLKRHLLIHTGEKPYKCSTCSRSFNNQSHLKRHTNKQHAIYRNAR